MEDRLPAALRDEIEGMLPQMTGKMSLSEAEKEEHRAIYAAIGEKIAKHVQDHGCGASWCHRHHQRCPVFSSYNGKKLPDGACELHGVGTSCKDESNMGGEATRCWPKSDRLQALDPRAENSPGGLGHSREYRGF
jgi:hypothetical protein